MKQTKNTSLEDAILDIVERSLEEYLTIQDIKDFLRIDSKKAEKKVEKAIHRLAHMRMLQVNDERIQLPAHAPKTVKTQARLKGTIDIAQNGRGYVAVEGYDEDIVISEKHLGMALQDDIVAIQLIKSNNKRQRTKGKVVEVLERGKQFYVGTLKETGKSGWIIHTDVKSAHTDFFVPKEALKEAKHNDKVLFRLVNWIHPNALPEADIVEIFGPKGSNNANILSILAESDLRANFPKEVEKFAENIPLKIPEQEIAKRKDIREDVVFTIDPHDAKDFDDALSIEVLENGNYYLGVHIADVTYYMPRNSTLDKEAIERGTSVYLVDRVIPMLPERLSNGVCSLRPREDKLTYSCFMEFNKQGSLINYSIDETVIHSNHRFTYEEAEAVLEGEEHELKPQLEMVAGLARKLLEKRYEKGSVDFDTPEPKFVLDENGHPTSVIIKKRLFAHRLIEECMLAANKTVAYHVEMLRKKKGNNKADSFPFFYRIHDKPDADKLANVLHQLKPLGLKITFGKNVSAASVNQLLAGAKNTPFEAIAHALTLRSMAKAEYSPKNIGHFGLGFQHYAHFTSPIRRYPDVLVHRLLKEYAKGKPSYTFRELSALGEHCSQCERKAVEAERDSVKLKQVEFLSDKIGEVFDGTISGVTERGLYVLLNEIYCEGMIKINRLSSDYFLYDDRAHALVGRSSGRAYRLGDSIRVKVENTDEEKRLIDFILA